jgi:hypothetical protein
MSEDGTGNGHGARANGVTELAEMLPELIKLSERELDVNKLKGQSVAQVIELLGRKTSGADKALVERARASLTQLPLINDMPFDEVYLRASAKS